MFTEERFNRRKLFFDTIRWISNGECIIVLLLSFTWNKLYIQKKYILFPLFSFSFYLVIESATILNIKYNEFWPFLSFISLLIFFSLPFIFFSLPSFFLSLPFHFSLSLFIFLSPLSLFSRTLHSIPLRQWTPFCAVLLLFPFPLLCRPFVLLCVEPVLVQPTNRELEKGSKREIEECKEGGESVKRERKV